MSIALKIPYSRPKRSIGQPAILHTGEVVLTVENTDRLNKWLNSKQPTMPKTLRQRLGNALQRVAVADDPDGKMPKFRKVIEEYNQRKLRTPQGKLVKNPRQALAIAYSEQRRADEQK